MQDYASIQMVMDHMQVKDGGANHVQKFVLSTQTPDEVLASLVEYYGEPHVLASPGGIAVVRESGTFANFAFVYINRENIQVVMDMETWAALNMRDEFGGSQLALVDMLQRTIAQSMADSIATYGSPAVLSLIGFDTAEEETAEEA